MSWDWKVNTPFLGSNQLAELQRFVPAVAGADDQGRRDLGEESASVRHARLSEALGVDDGQLPERAPVSLFTNANYTGSVDQGTDEPDGFREHQKINSFLYFNGGGSASK